MHVDLGRKLVAHAGAQAAHVVRRRARVEDALPAQQLGAPGDIGILAVGEELGVEELPIHRHVGDHLAPVAGRRGGGAEHVLVPAVVSVVGLHAAAILVAQHGREEHARGIEPLDSLDIEAGVGQQELAADRAGHRVHPRGHHQAVDEVRQQQHVRIEREHPISAREGDRLVLRGGESDVLLVVDHDAAILEALENVASAVSGGIVDDDHLQRPVSLLERRFQAAADEPPAVVRDHRYRDQRLG